MSASKRQRFDRMHGQNKSKDMHSMHGAATTLVDLAQTHPKDHGNVAVKHATEPQLAAVGRLAPQLSSKVFPAGYCMATARFLAGRSVCLCYRLLR